MTREDIVYVWVTTPPRSPHRERPAFVYWLDNNNLYASVYYLDVEDCGKREVERRVSVFRIRDMTPLEALTWATR